jgi:hypothetical protein
VARGPRAEKALALKRAECIAKPRALTEERPSGRECWATTGSSGRVAGLLDVACLKTGARVNAGAEGRKNVERVTPKLAARCGDLLLQVSPPAGR